MKRDATDTKDDIQSLARAHSADAIAVLAEIMNNTDAPAGARLSAAKALLDRGWGKAGAKPPDDGNRATPVSQIKRVIVDPRHGEELFAEQTKWSGGVRSDRLAGQIGPVDRFEGRTPEAQAKGGATNGRQRQRIDGLGERPERLRRRRPFQKSRARQA